MNSKRILLAVLAALIGGLLAQAGAAQEQPVGSWDQGTGYDYEGPYVQFGFNIGDVDSRDDDFGSVSGGFTMGGGYRILPSLATELNFTLIGSSGEAYYAFTVGPKFFPFGLWEFDPIPDELQPYGLVQFGGGEYTDSDKGVFAVRILIGFDYWIDDNLGAFAEGGGHVSHNDDFSAGLFTVGAQYRF